MPIYKQTIDEARAVQGKEYKNHVGDLENQIKSQMQDGVPEKDMKVQLHRDADGYKYSTTSTGRGGILDSIAQNQIEKIDLEKEKSILESSDIVAEYEDYINGHFEKALKRGVDFEKGRMEVLMTHQYQTLLKAFPNNSEQEIRYIVQQNFYGIDEFMEKCGSDESIKSKDDLAQKFKEYIETTLKFRINYINKITSLLAKMLKINYKELGLSEKECEIYLNSLSSGNNDSVKAAGELKKIIRDNADKYSINGGEGFDFRPLGFGCIFGTSEELNFKSTSDNKDAMLDLLQKVIRYDAVVLAHGGSKVKMESNAKQRLIDLANYVSDAFQTINIVDVFDPEVRKLLKSENITLKDYFNDLINSAPAYKMKRQLEDDNHLIKDIFEKDFDQSKKILVQILDQVYSKCVIGDARYSIYLDKFDKDTKTSIINATNSFLNSEKGKAFAKEYIYCYTFSYAVSDVLRDYAAHNSATTYWSCQPTRTLNGGPFEEVNELVRQLIKEGFKTILIEDCNPGHHELAKDIMDTKGIVINYSKNSNTVESSEIDFKNNLEYSYINEAEESLKDFAKSFNIDYNNDAYLVECCNWYLDGIENGFEPVNEGSIDSLKDFLKKIVAGIVGIIKRIVNFVKAGIQKFIEMFRGTKENPKDVKSETPKEIKTKLIDVNKKGIVEVSGKCRDDFEKHSKKTCADISAAIKDINSKQQAGLKDAEKIINTLPTKLETLKLPDKQGSSIALPDKSKDQNTNDSKTNESGNLYESLLSSITRSMVLEFDANGDEKNIPGVSDDDSSDYSFDDSGEDDSNADAATADSGDNNGNTTDQQNSPEDQNDDGTGSDEYSFGDDTSDTQDTNDDSQENSEDNDTADQDDSSNEDEYNLDDGEENNSDNNDDSSDGTEAPQDNGSDDAGSDEYDFDSSDDSSSGSDLDGEEGNSEGNAQSGLKKIEGELFENLSPKQKEIKIKALKQNFLDLYNRCGDVLDLISENTPSSEEESRIFDFVSKTITELQDNVHDYLADTFGTKTYIDNDAQFKQYLVILDSVKKILDEFLDVKTDKKEETGKK